MIGRRWTRRRHFSIVAGYRLPVTNRGNWQLATGNPPLHPFRHRDSQQLQPPDHRPPEDLRADGTPLALRVVLLIEDRILVVEAVELLRELEQVVRDDRQLESIHRAADR